MFQPLQHNSSKVTFYLFGTRTFIKVTTSKRVDYHEHRKNKLLTFINSCITVNNKVYTTYIHRDNIYLWRQVGAVVAHINEVAVRRARLVLGWVTVFGGHATLVSLLSHLGQLSLLPSVGRENEYQPKAVTFCGWGGNGRLWKWCGLPSITLGASPLPAQDHGSEDEHRTLASHSLCVQLC